jgi:hypothetical protein
MRPTANRTYAKSPASGRSASAACAADWIPVCPVLNSVAAVDNMMKYITTFENSIPVTTIFHSDHNIWNRCGELRRPP